MITYFVGAPRGLIKIGRTENLPRRFSTLRSQHGEDLRLIAVTDIPEWILHYALREHRAHGEWFKRPAARRLITLLYDHGQAEKGHEWHTDPIKFRRWLRDTRLALIRAPYRRA